MKKWLFVIAPALMLGLFLAYYTADRKRVAEREAKYKQAQEDKVLAKKRSNEEIAAKNKKDQEAKDSAQALADAAKEAEKKATADADRKTDLEATATARSNFQSRTAEIRTLDGQIAAAQRQRDQYLKEILDLTKTVVQAKIDRRTAELEFERSKAQLMSVLAQDPLMQTPVVPDGLGRGGRGGPAGPGGAGGAGAPPGGGGGQGGRGGGGQGRGN